MDAPLDGPVLAVRDVVKQYAAVRAVDRLSFDVGRGEIFALLGPNGAGKTTVVRMLLGIIQPDAGEVRWRIDGAGDGLDLRRIGYLPEERGLHRDVPVIRSLVHFGRLRGLSRTEARAAAEEWLEKLELADRARDKLDSLSKGNQQKVQFAAAVLHRPAFAVLDEPFSGFDPVNQERFLDHIRAMRDEGTTILLSAHQMQLVERAADRILLIDRGRTVLAGTLEEIRASVRVGRRLVVEVEGEVDARVLAERPDVVDVEVEEPGRLRLGLAGDGPLNDVLAALAQRVTIRSVHDERPTLHDVYVEAVRRRAEGAA